MASRGPKNVGVSLPRARGPALYRQEIAQVGVEEIHLRVPQLKETATRMHTTLDNVKQNVVVAKQCSAKISIT